MTAPDAMMAALATDSPAGDRDRADFIVQFADIVIDGDESDDALISDLRAHAPLFRDAADMAEQVFGGAARQYGVYWLEDRVDFVAVTLATNRLSLLLMQLEEDPAPFGYGAVPAPPTYGLVALLNAPGEQHGFGLSMLGYRLRTAGWRVYLAEDVADLRQCMAFRRPLVVGLSCPHDACVPVMQAIGDSLRARAAGRPPLIAMGGAAFADRAGELTCESADFVGRDADALLAWLGSVEAARSAPPAMDQGIAAAGDA